jgi:hypothetical protein
VAALAFVISAKMRLIISLAKRGAAALPSQAVSLPEARMTLIRLSARLNVKN